MAAISIANLTKSYAGLAVLKDFTLDIGDGEFIVFVGPSGCGKSTTLKIVAGLEPATSGTVRIGGRDVTDLAPGDRDIAMVFQNYALYPHLTVRRNMGFGLSMRGMNKSEVNRRVEEAARMLAIDHLLERRPKALSGGQRQRVALGRAIVREPKAFLMDEPLSNLDAALRGRMRSEIVALHRRLKITTIYVTHDQTEAMTMADRIVIMRDGEIQQIATPDEMFSHPANLFVAGFIGSPAMNFMQIHAKHESGRLLFTLFGHAFDVPAHRTNAEPGALIVGIRPEHFSFGREGAPIAVVPKLVETLGSEKHVHVTLPPEHRPNLQAGHSRPEAHDDTLIMRLPNDRATPEGVAFPVTFDPNKLQFFDPRTFEAYR